jgi:multimeric flavodoxin WrbA
MKALGISGSPRKGGNSETLLAAVIEGAVSSGVESDGIIRLEGLKYRGCRGCDACVGTGKCQIKDDMVKVHERIRDSRILVLSTPIYYDGVTGQFKTFFDRLRPFSKDGGRLEGARSGAIIATYADNENPSYTKSLEALLEYFTWFGDFARREVLAVAKLDGPGDAKSRPEVLAKGRELGRRLAQALKK